jgi:hypothetical protein
MSDLTLGERLINWGKCEPSVEVMIIVGSRANSSASAGMADKWSDWDFQIVTAKPENFWHRDWIRSAGLSQPIAYVNRTGRLGHTAKITGVFPEGDLDLVLIPANKLLALKWLAIAGLANCIPRARGALRDLSLVLRSGHRFVKSSRRWEDFFRSVIIDTPPSILDEDSICEMADGYVCDYVSTEHKIRRGEYLAAQLWLHVNLGEINFRLLHEINLRKGARSFPDGRRIEVTAPEKWREALAIEALPESESLKRALEKSAQTCRELTHSLVGTKWRWPDLSSRLH